MALQLGALRDALMNPGDEARANKAAEEVASHANRLTGIEGRLTTLTWMVGLLLAMVAAILFKLFAY